MRFPEIPADLSALSDSELSELLSEITSAFNDATSDTSIITDDDLAALGQATEGIESLRSEQSTRAEAAAARVEQLAELSSRVNVVSEDEGGEEETEGEEEIETEEVETEEPEVATTEAEAEVPVVAEAPVAPAAEQRVPVAASAPKPVTAGANIAKLKRGAPVKTRPRAEDPNRTSMTITAAADVPGLKAGEQIGDMRQLAEAFVSRHRNLGTGNGDNVPVARFNSNMSEDRKLTRHMSAEAVADRISSFDRSPQGITAAGGLCAPVNSYYEQMIIAEAARPVRDALANFQADRGGIRYNAPPKLSSLTSGVGTVTAAQDLSGNTKTAFAVTCPGITEVDVTSIYTSLLFGNFGARAYPEYVQGWLTLGLAKSARVAETALLDGMAAASTQVSVAGLVGAGRELFARLGQVASGYRSRNRMAQDAPLDVFLPGWTLDLVQADFARTFTDETGLISMAEADIEKLFGTRGLNVTWYLDSKTGGGQVFGAAAGGQTYTDGATNSNTTVTSATAAFTSADVGKTIVGAGIPAAATITAVGSATSVTISAAATATATGVTITIGRTTAAEFPSTVFAYMFPTGSFLHLDAGTLDLGLVRDSALNSTNQFQMFSETFENVALVGPESLEIVLSLQPTGAYAAAVTVTNPIVS